jgi:UDP:flavonoid glycosyltransferase YjiC (YdhE family)
VGKPVVYVHLGRVFGGESMWPRLNAAFTDGPFQAVVEQGRSGDPAPAPGADILTVRKPWMGPLVERSRLVLTNATSAPVLAALRCGRPLAVAPAGSEQPMLAEACVRAGVAVAFPSRVGQDLPTILAGAAGGLQLADNVRTLRNSLLRAPGPSGVADLIHGLACARPAGAAAIPIANPIETVRG